MIKTAKEENLELFTTSKDYVKIPSDLQKHINVLNIKIRWRNQLALEEFIIKKIG